MNNYSDNYDVLIDLIECCQLTAEDVLDLFVSWHGLEKLNREFMEFVQQEINY